MFVYITQFEAGVGVFVGFDVPVAEVWGAVVGVTFWAGIDSGGMAVAIGVCRELS